uniref:Uncharacterized protein n=1 Tax=Setaria italica TaxID=4555 RepID=K3ZPP3_SETIT
MNFELTSFLLGDIRSAVQVHYMRTKLSKLGNNQLQMINGFIRHRNIYSLVPQWSSRSTWRKLPLLWVRQRYDLWNWPLRSRSSNRRCV